MANPKKIRQAHIIIMLICIIGIILGSIFSKSIYGTIVFVFSGVCLGLNFCIWIIDAKTDPSKKRIEKLHQNMDDEIEKIVQSGVQNSKPIIVGNRHYHFRVIIKVPENTLCSISKTTLEKEDIAVQCPVCLNYFQSQYLIDWLELNETCPICKTVLRVGN